MQHYVWHKNKTVYRHNHIIPTLKYGGESIMTWGGFAASGPEPCAIVEGKMNSQVYQDNLQVHFNEAVYKLKLKRS